MKILQVTTFFHPVVGGVESHVMHLSKQLVESGHEVEILTTDSNKKAPRIKEKKSLVSGIKVIRARSWFSLSYFHKFAPGMLLHLLRSNYDIVHVHGFRKLESFFALFVAKLRKKKIVLTTHNPFPVNTRESFSEKLINSSDRTVGKLFTKYFDKIIVLVNSEKKILKERFNAKDNQLTKIPNGIQDMFFEQGNSESFYRDWDIKKDKWDGVVVGIGRINYVKGYQNLETTIKKLKKVLFFFAGGDDGYLEELKRKYKKYKNVIFTEKFVPQEKLIDIYKGGDLFLFPSLHEAFGLVLLEAMAQGMPVVSTNVGGPSEFVNDKFGVLLDPKDQDGWHKTINELIYDEKRRESMSKAGLEESKKYKWSKITNRVIKVYKDLLEI